MQHASIRHDMHRHDGRHGVMATAYTSGSARAPWSSTSPSGHGDGRDGRDARDSFDSLDFDSDDETLLHTDDDRSVDMEKAGFDDRGRRRRDQEKQAQQPPSTDESTVRWRDLPHRAQLAVLTLARLSEPLVQTSLQSYMFYQLKSFRPDLPSSAIATQSGILQSSFTAAQFLTAMVWGRLADSPRFGRKNVLMVGLAGTFISCLGFGFSQSFWQALFFRSLGGATNGNVGVLRTMISEIVQEKRFQSRAFLIMPLTYNIGVIVGPILGGLLSDPAQSYPSLFGDNAFLLRYPYAAPNLLSAAIMFTALVAVWLGLKETLDAKRDDRDLGIELRHKLCRLLRLRGDPFAYTPLAAHVRQASDASDLSDGSSSSSSSRRTSMESAAADAKRARTRTRTRYTQRLAFGRIFTRNVLLTLGASFLFNFHIGTFNALWFVFLSTPVYDAATAAVARRLPFVFSGGLGMPPRDVGLAMAVMGVFGIALQVLLYPPVSARLGTVRSFRVFLCCFPTAYFAIPLLSLVPSASPPPHAKDGVAVWLATSGVLLAYVTGRTFTLPAQTILVNNCTPHPSVLGTLHGLAQSISSLGRTLGPVLCGYLYGLGLRHGMVGVAFWSLSVVAVIGFGASLFVREGTGHEIRLEGDDDDDDDDI